MAIRRLKMLRAEKQPLKPMDRQIPHAANILVTKARGKDEG
jgi:hypothetical protein